MAKTYARMSGGATSCYASDMSGLSRRDTLKLLAVAATSACHDKTAQKTAPARETPDPPDGPVLSVKELGFPWPTLDPFLACMHHEDAYPAGTERFGPEPELLRGRNIGSDFGGKGGWSMYHGRVIPGFPQHPHRGFETVSVVRQGLLDHSDSLGAACRYGRGDVQWLTAGRGIQHAEMFPLLERQRDNPLEMFQIWLNLPKASKMVQPHFKILWKENIPSTAANGVAVTVIAGQLGKLTPPAPPPKSWASRADSHVAIWTIALDPGAKWTLPAGPAGVNRALYFHVGQTMRVAGRDVPENTRIVVDATRAVELANGPRRSELLLLQGRPIGEPVARRGPFVMNTDQEIQQAWADYRATRFGGWPWPATDPVHGSEDARFARYPDGRTERPT